MKSLISAIIFLSTTAQLMAQINYPHTNKTDQHDNYFGTDIHDPYRWLEEDTSRKVADWVVMQNHITHDYLNQIDERDIIKKRLTETWNYPKYSAPFKKGDFYFFYFNDGLKNQSILYRQKGLEGKAEIFLNPNDFSVDGTVSLSGLSFSHDNKYCTYSISQSGSDWQEVFVKEVASGKLMTDKINWTKFGGAAWYKDGFYYSRYPEPSKGMEFSTASNHQKVYYHKLGTAQAADRLVYEDPEHPKRYMWPSVSDNEKYLYLGLSEGTSGNAYLISKLGGKENFKPLLPGFSNNYGIIENLNGKLLVRLDVDAANYKIVLVDPAHPEETKWKTIVAANSHLLNGASVVDGKLFVTYLQDVTSRVYQYTLDGKLEKEIAMPGLGSVGGFGGEAKDKDIFYTFSSFIVPPSIYKFNVATGKSELYRKSDYPASLDNFETKQVFYPSKDGTQVPMFIIHKKGLELNKSNPTLLYGYGGFNISLTPSFSPSNLVFIENGGVYCVANLRGGGEYGEEWHKAGMLEKKQTVFDDFIAAAEYLIATGYTNSNKLAISGRSNGGLLVGACMTQRPELFKVALPGVGVLDMLRYHKFTVGWGWAVEYGTSDNEADFNYLIQYSPLHNLKEGIAYPATLITTADHDDRVVPAHSFKFAATLQEMYHGENPVLIRIDAKAGHGAGKPISKLIEEQADVWSFVFKNLGMTIAPEVPCEE